MSELKKLVPPLALCREVSENHPELFTDSALVWMHRTALDGICDEPFLVANRLQAEHYKREMYPAPTLAELRERLRNMRIFTVNGEWYVQCKTTSGAFVSEKAKSENDLESAALRLLMKIRRGESK